jgi:hypothetical protein
MDGNNVVVDGAAGNRIRDYRAEFPKGHFTSLLQLVSTRLNFPTPKTATPLGVHIGDEVLRLQQSERFSPIRVSGPSVKPEHLSPRTNASWIHDSNGSNFSRSAADANH